MLKKILSLFIIVVVVVSAETYTFAYYTNICETTGICKIVEINLKTKTITIIQEKKNNRSFTRTFTFKNDLVVDVGGEKRTIADIKVGDIVTIEFGEDNEVKNIAIKICRKPTSEEQKVINAKKEARKRWESEQKRIAEEEKRKEEKEKRKEINKRYNEFVKKNSVEEWPDISEFSANPFIYEGKIIALRVSFGEMQTATQGIFAEVGSMGAQPFVVSDIPKGMFKKSGTIVVLAGKVLGKTALQLPILGLMQVPHLRFVGAYFCQDNNCKDINLEQAFLRKTTPALEEFDVETLKQEQEESNAIEEAKKQQIPSLQETEYANYFKHIRDRISLYWFLGYGTRADLKLETKDDKPIIIEFKVYPNGTIDDVKIVYAAGNIDLASRLVSSIEKASPINPFPPNIKEPSIDVRFNFLFVDEKLVGDVN